MSKELTEQWRNGTLEGGWYFLEFENGSILPVYYCGFNREFEFRWDWKISKVLAPVPDYTEWKQTEEQVQNLQRMVEQECSKRCELESQLSRISEQLKEANDVLKQIADTRNFQYGHKFAQSYIKRYGMK